MFVVTFLQIYFSINLYGTVILTVSYIITGVIIMFYSQFSQHSVPRKPEAVSVYRHTIGLSTRHAIFFGFWGSLIYGLLLQIPLRLMLGDFILSTPVITDNIARMGYGIFMLLPFGGLFVSLMLLRSRWVARSHTEQLMTVLGLSFVYGMVFNIIIGSATFSVLSSRDTWTFFHQMPDMNTSQFSEQLGMAVYQIVAEAGGLSFLSIGLTILGGLALGLVLIPVEKQKHQKDDTSNAFLPLLACVLPITMLILFTINVVIYAMLTSSTAELLSDETARALAEIVMPLIQTMPVILGMVIAQIFLLIWLIYTKPETLHRRSTRFAQVMYGLVFGIGQIFYQNATSPGFTASDPGRWIIGLSTGLAIAWVIVAQVKIRQFNKMSHQVTIELSIGKYIRILGFISIIIWLMIDSFVMRTALNLIQIVVASIPTGTPYLSLPSVNTILAGAIHHNTLISLIALGITIIVTVMLLFPIVVCFRILERWKKSL